MLPYPGFLDVMDNVLARVPLACHANAAMACRGMLTVLKSNAFYRTRVVSGWGPETLACHTTSGAVLVDTVLRWMVAFPSNICCRESQRVEMIHGDRCRFGGPEFHDFAQISFGGPQSLAGHHDFDFMGALGMSNFYLDQIHPIGASTRLRDAWWTVVGNIFRGLPLPDPLTVLSLYRRNHGDITKKTIAHASVHALIWNGSEYGLLTCEHSGFWPLPHYNIEVRGSISADWVQSRLLATLVAEARKPAASFTHLCSSFWEVVRDDVPSSWSDTWTFAEGTEWEGWHEEPRHNISVADYVGGEGSECLEYLDSLYSVSMNQVSSCPFCDGVEHSVQNHVSASSVKEMYQTTVEIVEHLDPPATVEPAEAAIVSHQMWAGAVEGLTAAASSGMVQQEETVLSEEIFMFKLNRNPNELMLGFRTGLPLKDCRDSLEQSGFTCEMAAGGLIFVHPWQFHACMQALIGKETGPSTIIAARSLEHLLEETLIALGNRPNVWMKSRDFIATVNVEDNGSGLAAAGGDDIANSSDVNQDCFDTIPHWSRMYTFVEDRFFLCEVSHSSDDAVTQSTSDARPSGINPRRLQPTSFE